MPRTAVVVLALTACKPDILLPDVESAVFVEGIDHPYLPFPAGASWVHETGDGVERIEVSVPGTTRDVNGVTATVVRDTVYVDGEMIEDTDDWYAQDADGNVWYLGEDTCEYENGECVSTTGAWEWGVDGALPGFAMPADPTVDGQPYFQEFYPGEAEDVGEVIDVDASAEVPGGTFDDCITTRDTSNLDPALNERKTYCRGVGVVLVEESSVTEELIEYVMP